MIMQDILIKGGNAGIGKETAIVEEARPVLK